MLLWVVMYFLLLYNYIYLIPNDLIESRLWLWFWCWCLNLSFYLCRVALRLYLNLKECMHSLYPIWVFLLLDYMCILTDYQMCWLLFVLSNIGFFEQVIVFTVSVSHVGYDIYYLFLNFLSYSYFDNLLLLLIVLNFARFMCFYVRLLCH